MSSIYAWKLLTNEKDYTLEPIGLPSHIKSLNDLSLHWPQGVYTTFRTFNHNKVLPLDLHFSRLEESARLIGKPVILNRDFIRLALNEISTSIPFENSRVRLTLELSDIPFSMLISFENLKTPTKDEYKSGVKTLTYEYKRQNPKAKSTSFLQNVEKIRIQTGNKSINEVLLHDETGYILEGLSSNFFAVKNGVLYTSERDILLGIIRSIVLRCAQNLGVEIVFEPIKTSEINEIEEAFITSASRGILPVSIINDETIANGLPGRITKSLMLCYEKTILEELEHI